MKLLQELLSLTEAKKLPYQVRVADGADWVDTTLNADSLEDIAAAVGASPADEKAHEKFGLFQLTPFIHKWIGDGPDGYGKGAGSWDEMDMDVKSLKDDVLKISWTFSGVNMRRKEDVVKKGVMTIMPGA